MRTLTAPAVLVVVLSAALLTSTVVVAQQGQSEEPTTNGTDVDRASLEELCQQNAPDADELSVCIDVVRTYLAPEADAPTTAAVASDDVTVTGKGQKTTKAFDLAGGDYRVELKVKDPDPGESFGLGCSAWAYLKDAEDRSSVDDIRAGASGRKTNTVNSYFYSVPEGRYYWDFDISSCSWDVNLKSTTIDYDEPLPGVVVRKGTSGTNTEAFALTGGDYLASWSLKAGKSSCNVSGYLKDAEGDFFSVGDFEATAKKSKNDSGETRLFAIEPGHYYWEVNSLSFSGADQCKWTVTITAEE